ncbi:hypothetical protein G6F31_015392 [Rhizopus arrhizus]|nr:hypothetical protein G6F31_015392 [Rhizopus arrhizus]
MGKQWLQLFNDTRQRFRQEVAEIPIADQAFRLRALGKIYDRHISRGNVVGAAAVLEQAAKEAGGLFTNKQKLEHAGAGGGPIQTEQERFLASSADIVIYGGSAGGGKTFGLLLESIRHSARAWRPVGRVEDTVPPARGPAEDQPTLPMGFPGGRAGADAAPAV